MNANAYARVRELFDRAVSLSETDRNAFVDTVLSSGDPLRPQLAAMLRAGDDSDFLATAAAAGLLDAARTVMPGTPSRIGRYKVLKVLGRGGMGVVYLGLRDDEAFRKVVAIKMMLRAVDPHDLDAFERFKRERQILAELDHPNIARILDGGNTDDGRPFYVMEYVPGSPIDEYCARMNCGAAARVRMIAEACDAVAYLHDHAIIHRDIKPPNLLVAQDGRVKLLDFGIAKIESAGQLHSGSSGQPTLAMTPGYASPEQAGGEHAGKGTDTYSLGVVLYQLLAGSLPFIDADGRPDLCAQLIGKVPDKPSVRRAASRDAKPPTTDSRKVNTDDVDRVVLAALRRDPAERYATVQQFGEDLRRCLDGRPITARPATVTYQVSKLVGRNRAATAAIAAAVLAVVIGGWFFVSVTRERAALEAKASELEKFVALLNTKVSQWQEPAAAIPTEQKVADVQAAQQVMKSESVRELSTRAPNPARVKTAIDELRNVLDRADAASSDQPRLRKEIATTYRSIGDFESKAQVQQLADRGKAAESYQRAALIAAAIRAVDQQWAERELSELTGALAALGVTISLPPPVTAEAAAAPEPRPASQAAPRAPSARVDGVDEAARADVVLRLRSVGNDAARARHSLEAMRVTLQSRGQVIQADLGVALGNADGLIEDARAALEANDLETAEEYLRRAAGQLRKVFQTVGG